MELLIFLCVGVGLSASGYLWRRRQAALPPPRPQRERTLSTLRAGDVIQHMGSDYLVETVTRLEEAGSSRLLCRLLGGSGPGYLWVRGPETADPDDDAWLLEGPPLRLEEPPPEQILAGGLRYQQTSRCRVEAAYLLPGADSGRANVSRVTEYRSAGAARLLVLARGDGEPSEGLLGRSVPRHFFEILPGGR